MLFRSFLTLVLVSSGMARKSHHGLICSFFFFANMPTRRFHSPCWSSRQSNASRENMIQSFIVLLQRILSLQGLASQEVKRDKASETAVLLSWNSAGSNHPEGTASSILLADWEQKGKIHILEFTPPSQERAETCTLEPPAGERVNSTSQR